MKTLSCLSLTALLAILATEVAANPYGYTPIQYQTTAVSPHNNYQQTVPGYQQSIPTHPAGMTNTYPPVPTTYTPTPVYQPVPMQTPGGYQQPTYAQPPQAPAAYGQPAYTQPAYAQPTYRQLGPPATQYARPGYATPTPLPAPIYAPVTQTPEAITAPPAGTQPSTSYYDSYGSATSPSDTHSVVQGGHPHAGYPAADFDGYGAAGGCYDGGYGGKSRALCRGWYGSFGGLWLTRNDPNKVVLTSNVNWPEEALMSTTSADVGWEGGYEITFGRRIKDCLRWEVGFWNVNQFKDCAEVWSPTQELITPMNLNNIALGPDDLDEFYDNSSSHAVLRKDNLYSLELNLYYRLCCKSACGHCCKTACGGCGHGGGGAGYGAGYGGPTAGDYYATCGAACFTPPPRWNVELLAGVRYFNFDEHIIFAGLEGGANWGDLGGQRQAWMMSDVENHLIGLQLGALIEYNLTCHWSIYARPKVGFYNNHSEHLFNVGRGNYGDWGQNVATGEWFPVRSSKDDFSVLAELDLGVRWNFGCHWSAYAGYRLVAISGIALADNQFPAYLADMNGIRHIDTNGDLILHGLNFGLGFQY